MCAKGNSKGLLDKETLPKPGSRAYVVYDILRTTSYLRRSYADIFDQRGITFEQYNVVRILRGARPGGLPTLAIAERLIDETPGITLLLDRLEDCERRLVVAQGDERIDGCGAASRHVTGHDGDQGQDGSHAEERPRIGSADAVEQTGQ
jgi:hypothetical protein